MCVYKGYQQSLELPRLVKQRGTQNPGNLPRHDTDSQFLDGWDCCSKGAGASIRRFDVDAVKETPAQGLGFVNIKRSNYLLQPIGVMMIVASVISLSPTVAGSDADIVQAVGAGRTPADRQLQVIAAVGIPRHTAYGPAADGALVNSVDQRRIALATRTWPRPAWRT